MTIRQSNLPAVDGASDIKKSIL
jgi:hypothetical protein